jgi:hypothetical protein
MDMLAALTDNVPVRRVLYSIVVLAALSIVLTSAPAYAEVGGGGKSPCELISSAQVRELLGPDVITQGVGSSECGYAVPVHTNPAIPTQMNVRLSKGEQALSAFRRALNPKTKFIAPPGSTVSVQPHYVKVAGTRSYWTSGGSWETSVSSGGVAGSTTSLPALQSVTFNSSKHGFVLQITVQGVSNPKSVAQQATGDALQSL